MKEPREYSTGGCAQYLWLGSIGQDANSRIARRALREDPPKIFVKNDLLSQLLAILDNLCVTMLELIVALLLTSSFVGCSFRDPRFLVLEVVAALREPRILRLQFVASARELRVRRIELSAATW